MLLVMPLSVDLSFAGNNTPESKEGIVCTPSWTLNTKKLEETSEPHFIAVCNSLVPISLLRIRLLVAKEKREVTVRIPEMKSLISSTINIPFKLFHLKKISFTIECCYKKRYIYLR